MYTSIELPRKCGRIFATVIDRRYRSEHAGSYCTTKARARFEMDATESVSRKIDGQSPPEHRRVGKGHTPFRSRSDRLGIKFRAGRFARDLSNERSRAGGRNHSRAR